MVIFTTRFESNIKTGSWGENDNYSLHKIENKEGLRHHLKIWVMQGTKMGDEGGPMMVKIEWVTLIKI